MNTPVAVALQRDAGDLAVGRVEQADPDTLRRARPDGEPDAFGREPGAERAVR